MLARWRAEWWHSSGRGGPDALGLVFTLLHGHMSMPEDAASSACVDQAEHRDNLHTGRAGRGNAGPKSQGGRCQPRPTAHPQPELRSFRGLQNPHLGRILELRCLAQGCSLAMPTTGCTGTRCTPRCLSLGMQPMVSEICSGVGHG